MKRISTPLLLVIICLFTLSLFHVDTAGANESSVKIVAPDYAEIGSEITVELQANHSGNNFLHYTEWLYVMINGKEIKRWEFGNFDKPEDEQFTRSITYTVTGPLEITAEASCNFHGSMGVETKVTQVK
jgi:desulfoferrodoxin (superoxide reductase-like protein)